MQDQSPASDGHFQINPRVLCRAVEDEAVLLDLDAGQYYGLNAVGYRIWDLLSEDCAVASICDALLQEFEVSPEAIRPDVDAFIEALLAKRLLLNGRGARAAT